MSRTRYLNALAEKVKSAPKNIFLRSIKGKSIAETSFEAFGDLLLRAASGLSKRGVVSGDVVLIFSAHGAETLACFVGCQMLGAIPSFMPPPTPKLDQAIWLRSHDDLVRRIKPRIVVADESCFDAVARLGADVVGLPSLFLHQRMPHISIEAKDDDIAFLQHSSGTTGLKKGVMVSYQQLTAQLESYGKSISVDPQRNTIVTWLPIYHDMGLIAATLLPIYFGLPITSIETFTWLADPSLLVRWLSKSSEPIAWLPNFAFRYLALRSRHDLSIGLGHVHAIINCSEPCKADDMDAFAKRFAENGLNPTVIRVCYAMAENVFGVTQTAHGRLKSIDVDAEALEAHGEVYLDPATQRRRNMVSVGSPIDGVEIRIAAAHGAVGEVEVSGVSLCGGYFGNDSLTAQKFVDGWYRTGDLGFLHDGELYITGRIDDLIIVRGKNIYAHDVEAAVNLSGAIKPGRCVTFGIEDVRGGTQNLVVAAEVADLPANATIRAINDVVSAEFGIAPADIVVLAKNTLIKTTSGKISRSENAARYLSGTLVRWNGGGHVN